MIHESSYKIKQINSKTVTITECQNTQKHLLQHCFEVSEAKNPEHKSFLLVIYGPSQLLCSRFTILLKLKLNVNTVIHSPTLPVH